jgi:hypothetical protein
LRGKYHLAVAKVATSLAAGCWVVRKSGESNQKSTRKKNLIKKSDSIQYLIILKSKNDSIHAFQRKIDLIHFI